MTERDFWAKLSPAQREEEIDEAYHRFKLRLEKLAGERLADLDLVKDALGYEIARELEANLEAAADTWDDSYKLDNPGDHPATGTSIRRL